MATPDPVLDSAELAWAAGFFDGEGSTIARTYAPRRHHFQLNVTVPQAGDREVPTALLRFQRAMLGMGHITRRTADGVYVLRFSAREEASLVLELLWPSLGQIKRAQATRSIALADGWTARRRPPRKLRPSVPPLAQRSAVEIERAWAAGFLDAEGCFGLNRGKARVRGPVWYRIRVSADQHGVVGEAPEVLVRLQAALGGIGRIHRHGAPDDYKWSAEGRAAIEHVLALTGQWLGDEKRAQAAHSVEKFDAQTRLKGDATHCVRGHPYTRVALRGGRLRRICNPCERLTDRARRAALGIAPRQFTNRARRYTA